MRVVIPLCAYVNNAQDLRDTEENGCWANPFDPKKPSLPIGLKCTFVFHLPLKLFGVSWQLNEYGQIIRAVWQELAFPSCGEVTEFIEAVPVQHLSLNCSKNAELYSPHPVTPYFHIFCRVSGSPLADLQQFFTGKLYVLVYQLKLPAEELLWLALSWHVTTEMPMQSSFFSGINNGYHTGSMLTQPHSWPGEGPLPLFGCGAGREWHSVLSTELTEVAILLFCCSKWWT
ncbi:hypothetical protein QQF64_008623 [Cirrhinus molitorella]|uniref:Uncharacterized protein n=1 Tax=Cirrhinus molitorella TaxID=172907 RepID=A0ABR3M6P5_9TELE